MSLNFQLFDVCFFQESPQSDFPRDNEGGECEKRVERNYMKKVFQVETTKLRGFLFAFTTSEGSEKKSRQSCRHFNCIYSYFNFNASTSRSIALKKQVSIILLHQAFAASRTSNVSCQRAKFHIKKILFHRVIKRRRRQQRDAE